MTDGLTMKRNSGRDAMNGVTLLEIMIVMIIVLTLTSLGVITLGANREKNRLLNAANGVVDVFTRAQKEAVGQQRIMGACFKTGTNGTYAQAYVPTLASSGLPTDADCTSGETPRVKVDFGSTVALCATCDTNIALNKSVFFSPIGFPILQNGNAATFQICLIDSRLPAGARAREVEVTSGGMTQLVKPGSAGSLASVQANTGSCQ